MENKGKKNWWFLAVNGMIAILFGLLLLLFSQESIKALVIYFGIALMAGGVILLITAVHNIKQNKKAGMILFESIICIAIGLIMVLFPQDSLSFFLILIGVWAIIVGVVQLATLINIKEKMASKNLLLFNGLLTIALGVFLFFDPFTMAKVMVQIAGVLSIIFGILMIWFGFALKSLKEEMEKAEEAMLPEADPEEKV
jgi:uncharacterized membrane protein HdeD (DUF308 family)